MWYFFCAGAESLLDCRCNDGVEQALAMQQQSLHCIERASTLQTHLSTAYFACLQRKPSCILLACPSWYRTFMHTKVHARCTFEQRTPTFGVCGGGTGLGTADAAQPRISPCLSGARQVASLLGRRGTPIYGPVVGGRDKS